MSRIRVYWSLVAVLLVPVEACAVDGLTPHAPEPMVFDLVRPLGVREGEVEVNVLGIVPFRRERHGAEGLFPSGEGTEEDSPAHKRRGPRMEWAPEIEFAPIDNLAFEFEVPFADATLAEYKAGAQWSFAPSDDGRFIDGVQALCNVDADGASVTPTLLYLTAWRLGVPYTVQSMFGFRRTLGSRSASNQVDFIFNPTFYAEIGDGRAVGLESNITLSEQREFEWLLMPQAAFNLGRGATVQFGIGARLEERAVRGESALRLITEL